MNPTTNQPQNQASSPQPEKGANNAAASLAFATHLQTQMMQHQNPKAPEISPQSMPEGDTEEKKEPNLTEELTKFKTEIEGLLDSKLGDLKREIETALQDEPDEKTETTKTA